MIRFSMWLVRPSGYAHVFVLVSTVTAQDPFTRHARAPQQSSSNSRKKQLITKKIKNKKNISTRELTL